MPVTETGAVTPPATTNSPSPAADAGLAGSAGGHAGAAAPLSPIDAVSDPLAGPSILGTAGNASPASPAAPPANYAFALDGMTIDATLASAADPVLRELGLTNEQANSLLPLAKSMVEAREASLMRELGDALSAQKKQWLDAFQADPDIGGHRRAETEHLAARGLDALGFRQGHPFRKALSDSGFGNHPDMIRAFRRLGELVGEDAGFVRAGAGAPATKPVWERMYPNEAR